MKQNDGSIESGGDRAATGAAVIVMRRQREIPPPAVNRPLGSDRPAEKATDMAAHRAQAAALAAENYRELHRHYDTFLAAYDMLMKHHGIFLLRQAVFDETLPRGTPYQIGEDQAQWITGATYYYAGQLREMLRELERRAAAVAQHATATAIPADPAAGGGDYLTKAWMLSESEQLLLRARLEVRGLLARLPAPQHGDGHHGGVAYSEVAQVEVQQGALPPRP